MTRVLRARWFYVTSLVSLLIFVVVLTSDKPKADTNVLHEESAIAERIIEVEDVKLVAVAASTVSSPQGQDEDKKQEEEVQEVPEQKSEEKAIATTTRKSLSRKEIFRCSDSFLDTRFEYYGNFVVITNYVKASKEFGCEESITLTAPGDFRFLDNVEPLVERWMGPLSIALYAPGDDFHSTLESIAYLRRCRSELIKEYVTFHLFFEHEHMPKATGPLVTAYKDEFNCSTKPPYEVMKDDDLYKTKHGLTYPINLARNIAKINVQTHFVFPSDIELYPTRNFIPKFIDMILKYPHYITRGTRNVFVLPIFEVFTKVPETKTELQNMLKNGSAILFHKQMCSLCHRIPEDKEWQAAEENQELDVFTAGKRQGRNAVWEPFFVCTQREPLWDDRFNWEGQSNKMVQAYHMCMLDYNFLILDNAFLIHKPGVKKKKVQIVKHHDQVDKNTAILIELSKELPKIYGENENCIAKLSLRKKGKVYKNDDTVSLYFKKQKEKRLKMLEEENKLRPSEASEKQHEIEVQEEDDTIDNEKLDENLVDVKEESREEPKEAQAQDGEDVQPEESKSEKANGNDDTKNNKR